MVFPILAHGIAEGDPLFQAWRGGVRRMRHAARRGGRAGCGPGDERNRGAGDETGDKRVSAVHGEILSAERGAELACADSLGSP